MKWNKSDAKNQLDEAIRAVCEEDLSAGQMEQTATRVRGSLENRVPAIIAAETERIEGCHSFQALIPAYLSNRLSSARRTLFEDHMRECAACRRVFWQARSGVAETALPPKSWKPIVVYKWGVAAAVLVLFAVINIFVIPNIFWPAQEVSATVERIDGSLHQVADGTMQPVKPGQVINEEDTVRTARGSKAFLKLSDGSVVEMNERTELSLDSRRDGASIDLRRGGIIVEAAKQKSGRHLQVATLDARVTVKGTVFSVTRGVKGSRVSVIEGEVSVQRGKSTTILKPGQQVTTHASLVTVPVADDFAWSQNVSKHIALMREIAVVGQAINDALAKQPLRYTSRLLPLVPADTMVYATFPNLSQTVGEIYTLFSQRVKENPELQQWWAEHQDDEIGLDEIVNRLTTAGSFLGNEIVIAVADLPGDEARPIVLAEVSDAAKLRAAIEDSIARIAGVSGEQPKLMILNDPAAAPDGGEALLVYIGPDVFVATTNAAEMKAIGQRLAGAESSFATTLLYERLARSYSEGVGTLFAVDMQTVIAAKGEEDTKGTGFGDIAHLMIENRTIEGENQSRATLSFNHDRRGMAAWLAEPAPMASLEYVSPDAFAMACFLVKDPVVIVDELFELIQTAGKADLGELGEFQSKTGLSLREDVAAPLGREFLFAVDGPLLPTPAWKVVAEVDDPAHFQQTIERLVAEVNARAAAEGKPGLTISTGSTGGVNYHKIAFGVLGQEADYVFTPDGYMVMTASPALLLQTLQYRETGYSLARSITALMPTDRKDHASALLYQNFLPVVASLANYVPNSTPGLTPEQVNGLREAAANTPPTLIAVYGDADQITLASRGLPGMNLVNMAAFSDVSRMVEANTKGANAFAPTK